MKTWPFWRTLTQKWPIILHRAVWNVIARQRSKRLLARRFISFSGITVHHNEAHFLWRSESLHITSCTWDVISCVELFKGRSFHMAVITSAILSLSMCRAISFDLVQKRSFVKYEVFWCSLSFRSGSSTKHAMTKKLF